MKTAVNIACVLALAFLVSLKARERWPDVIPDIVPTPYVQTIDGDGLQVLIVVESEDITPQQGTLIHSAAWQDYVDSKNGDWCVLDPDATIADAKWSTALQRQRESLPWVIVDGDDSGFEGPLPQTGSAWLELLRKHGD